MDLNNTFLSQIDDEPITRREDFKSDLKGHLNKITDSILKEHKTTQKLVKRVLEEVKSSAPRKNAAARAILPKEPYKAVEQFTDFEKRIQSSENKFNDLVIELQSIVCGNPIRFIKMVWRKVMSDDAAKHFCWKGTSNKQAIRSLSMTGALKQAYNQKFANSTDEDFERTNMSFLHQANNRLAKKKQYGKPKENVPDIN